MIEGRPSPEDTGIKNYKEIATEGGNTYFEEMKARMGSDNELVRPVYEKYQKLISEGDYFNDQELKKTPYDFLQGALGKYEYFQKVFADDNKLELSKDYQRRVELVKSVIQAMEQDPKFQEFIAQKDKESAGK